MDPDHSRIMSHMEDLIQQLRLSDSSNRSAAPGASASASNNPVQAHISPSAHSRRSFHSQPPRSNHGMPHHPSPQHPAVLGPFTAPIQSPPVHHGPLPLGTPVPAMAHPSPAQSAYWPSQPGAAFPHRTHGQRTSHHWQNPPQISRGVSLMDYARPGQPHSASQQPPRQATFPPHHSGQHVSHPTTRPADSNDHRPRNHPRGRRGAHHGSQHGAQHANANTSFDTFVNQGMFLDNIARQVIPAVAISPSELQGKIQFRLHLEAICRNAYAAKFPASDTTPNLLPYGSLMSGFAVAGSDMDIICDWTGPGSDVEFEYTVRLFEGALLNAGIGARALTKTRVPILKICQNPTAELLSALKLAHDEWVAESTKTPVSPMSNPAAGDSQDATKTDTVNLRDATTGASSSTDSLALKSPNATKDSQPAGSAEDSTQQDGSSNQRNRHLPSKWRREKALGPLDFPKSGVGFQCDVSFRAVLGIYNTRLLRCYSACDPRVRDMILVIKTWAKRRKVNSGYHGTLCSYGWVLLVLHFLINVAQPPVLPNLQLEFGAAEKQHMFNGYNVSFADDEKQLQQMGMQGLLTKNGEPLGALLRNFFHYYAHQGHRVIGGGFRWKDDVICIQERGGLVSKSSKGWTGATTTITNGIEVRQRYLLAVECPLERGHNVARTVHHFGVVAIRDELRRAWNILESVGRGESTVPDLMAEVEIDTTADEVGAPEQNHSLPTPEEVQSAQLTTESHTT